MGKYDFVVVLTSISEMEITPALADAVYGATGGDIEFNMRDGVPFIEFRRKAASLREAITTAIVQVEGAAEHLRVVRVESESANVIAKINAELLGATSAG